MAGAKTAYTPIQSRHNLGLAKGPVLKDIMKYRRLVGRLVYLTITRPDLVYSVHVLLQFVNEPKKEHCDAALRVVRYVKRNPSKGITLNASSDYQLRGFCDSDYAGCPVTRRSLSGYFVSIGGSPISWKVKKQVTVVKSTAEAEYRAMGSVTSELLWLKSFLVSLGVFHTNPMLMFCDNQAALHISKNPVFHDRTKHIEIDCHFVRQHLVSKVIKAHHVPSKEQIADLFTKALGGESFDHLSYKLGLGLPRAPT
ncbi:secreted RxLR effector protein 161-like [Silene latifolia]|uniref:secreted RxLR effector protein 161-like n=1 Tax=Silene latifolia TaxID=37657 RepID=UPI003D775FC0